MNCSIIITFYNKNELLLNAIGSVIKQIDENDEIIVVNDCSTHIKSKEALKTAIKKYPKILFLNTKKNNGASFAKDFGIKNSKNDIIVLLDGDDVIPESVIKKIKQAFLNDNTLSLVFGDYIKNELDRDSSTKVDCSHIAQKNDLLDPFKLAKQWILLGSSPFKKNMYFDSGGFDKLYPKTDDVDFQRRLILNGYKCRYLNEVIYIWNRYPEGNNSGHSREIVLFSKMRSFEFYYKFLSKKDFCLFLIKTHLKSFFLKCFIKHEL